MHKIMMLWFGVIFISTSFAGEMEEIEVFAKKKQWNIVLYRLNGVVQAERTARWRALIEEAAVGYLQDQHVKGFPEMERLAEELKVAFPTLQLSTRLEATRVKIYHDGFDKCLKSEESRPRCYTRLLEVARETKQTEEFLRMALVLLAKHPNSPAKLEIYKLLMNDTTRGRLCLNDELYQLSTEGLKETGHVRNIASHVAGYECLVPWKKRLQALKNTATGELKTALCEILKDC